MSFKSRLWEALDRAVAVLSWLGVEEAHRSLGRCVGRLWRVCRRAAGEPLANDDLGCLGGGFSRR